MASQKTRQNITPVDINKDIYKKIVNHPDRQHTSIRKYTNILLDYMFKNEEFAHELFPKLEKIV